MKTKSFRLCLIAFAAFLVLGAAFYLLAGDSLHFTARAESPVSKQATVVLHPGDTLTQPLNSSFDTLTSLTLYSAVMDPSAGSTLTFTVSDAQDGTPIASLSGVLSAESIASDSAVVLTPLPAYDAAKNQKQSQTPLSLTVTYLSEDPDSSVSFYFGNAVNTGRFLVAKEVSSSSALQKNGTAVLYAKGSLCTLCVLVNGTDFHVIGTYYWWIYAGAALLLAAYLTFLFFRHRKKKTTPLLSVVLAFSKYNFLIRQLVSRDFKSKYKRSVLGMLWSFLNPLLTMVIQYIIFSTLFSSDIPNFAIYLLSGIVCFNFFNEVSNMCLQSIVGNASLINKVYVPKFIYPFSRTLSSGINLLLSLVPLFLVMLITRTAFTPAILLLPIPLFFLFLVSYGIGCLLATMMVFFRDTQFLWGIFSMLLMYMTPLFYPDTIIPARFMPIYKLNPLYHVIRMVRSLLMDGISPEPKAYLICAALCLIPFLFGIWVFRKNQDKFVLNI